MVRRVRENTTMSRHCLCFVYKILAGNQLGAYDKSHDFQMTCTQDAHLGKLPETLSYLAEVVSKIFHTFLSQVFMTFVLQNFF